MRIEKTVFISYRRTNTFHALAVYKELTARGYDVFLDTTSIDSGAFDKIILRQIDARAHFLVLLTPSALERCTEPGDWLRREIERALEMKRNIVPLMFEGFNFGNMQQYLTGKLTMLKQYNGLTVPTDYFDEAMGRLCSRFLNTPLDTVIHPTPPEDVEGVQQRQAEAASAPQPTGEQLSAEQYNERGDKRYKEGNLPGALADFNEAIRLNPQYAIAYYNRGVVHGAQDNLDKAITDYNEAIRLNPQYANAHYNRGVARKAQGDADGAIADYTEAIRLNPQHVDAYNNRGVAHTSLGNLDGAIADYNEAIRINPQYANAYVGRSAVRYDRADYAGAIVDCNEALRLDPQHAMAYNNRGAARQMQGDVDGAIQDYEAALRIDPNNQTAKTNLENVRNQRR